MRGKRWRIWKTSLILKKRIKSRRRNNYYPFHNNASVRIIGANWVDYISSYEVQKLKSIVTDKWDTRWKTKYSPNKTKPYWRDVRGKNKTTRERERIKLLKIKSEYGI
jgi:hypothetical protein